MAERLREAIEALEAVVRDRGLLRGALGRGADAASLGGRRMSTTPTSSPPATRRRPRAAARRQRSARARRAGPRRDRAAAASRQARLHDARTSTRPPSSRRRTTRRDEPERREVIEPQHCYVCKQHYRRGAPLLRPAVPGVRRLQLRASAPRSPTSRGRVALLTGGRVKIGYQAGIKLLRAGAQLIVTTRFPRDCAAALRPRARLRRVGRPARDLRARPAPHAERRGVLRTT